MTSTLDPRQIHVRIGTFELRLSLPEGESSKAIKRIDKLFDKLATEGEMLHFGEEMGQEVVRWCNGYDELAQIVAMIEHHQAVEAELAQEEAVYAEAA